MPEAIGLIFRPIITWVHHVTFHRQFTSTRTLALGNIQWLLAESLPTNLKTTAEIVSGGLEAEIVWTHRQHCSVWNWSRKTCLCSSPHCQVLLLVTCPLWNPGRRIWWAYVKLGTPVHRRPEKPDRLVPRVWTDRWKHCDHRRAIVKNHIWWLNNRSKNLRSAVPTVSTTTRPQSSDLVREIWSPVSQSPITSLVTARLVSKLFLISCIIGNYCPSGAVFCRLLSGWVIKLVSRF